jgi:hypothetical protein
MSVRWQDTRRHHARPRRQYIAGIVRDAILIFITVLVLVAASVNGWSP